jgi:hypothetical protein
MGGKRSPGSIVKFSAHSPPPQPPRSRTGETGAIAEHMQGGRTDMISGSGSE